jgi:hypothetical protein
VTERVDPGVSRALFSLGTGLEVAASQRNLQAVERAKQASVLFDEIVVESGLHVVEMTANGMANTQRMSKEHISPDLLLNTRTLEEGTTSGIGVRQVGEEVELYFGTNLPRVPDCEYLERPVAYRYVSEYHSGLLDDLARGGADWVRVFNIFRDRDGGSSVVSDDLAVLEPSDATTLEPAVLRLNRTEAQALAEQLGVVAGEAARRTLQEEETTRAGTPASESVALVGALKEALDLAAELRAVPALSSAFQDIAAARGVAVQLPGVESLGFVVPNFSVLPWEEIARFRDHPGSVEARGRLREFESEVAARELPGSAEYVRSTGRAVSEALIGVARDLAPSLPEDLQSPVLGSAIGLVPIVGQYASLAVSMGDIVAALRQSQAFEGSWVAAVFELRDAAADAALDW